MADMTDYYLDSADYLDFNPKSELSCKFCGAVNLHWEPTDEFTYRGRPIGKNYRLFTRDMVKHSCGKYTGLKH